jgi:hypothetical protein
LQLLLVRVRPVVVPERVAGVDVGRVELVLVGLVRLDYLALEEGGDGVVATSSR